ncbi:MAG TPA: glycosyltransferase family 1 protein [Chlamydiales bacterium]|nr:glycosyltransferase family 1 protein [Chlamydiales bacterium]
MKKEICIDARMATSSGIGTYIRSLVPRLKDFFSIRLIVHPDCAVHCPEFTIFDQIVTSTSIYSLQEQWFLSLNVPKCDLFWSPHFNVPLGPLRARRRLVTIHDVFFLACPHGLGLLKKCYAKLFFNAAVRLSDHVITDSCFSYSEIGKYIGSYENKITTVPLGVDKEKFQKKTVNEEIQVPSKFILFVGNLAPHKNIINLIRSLDFLPSDVHLVLVGKESKWENWKAEAQKRKDRITVCGKVKHETLVWLYQNAVMLVHPSLYEGFGFTPLEAMSAGCPVLTSKLASLPEVCADAVEYVDPYSIENIANSILSVWNNHELRAQMKLKGNAQVTLFNWDKCAQKHVEIIDRILI